MLAAPLLSVFEAAATPSLARALLHARKNLHDAPAPQIFEAAARMPDGLREADLTWLLARDEARYRVIVARTVSGSNAAATLRRLLASDPAPEVRAAAMSRLVALADSEALVLGLTALADVDPLVRSAAARGAASFGAQAVTGLRSVAYGTFEPCAGSEEAPRSAIASLSLTGAEGRKALNEIARRHPDESLRMLAGIALGEMGRVH